MSWGYCSNAAPGIFNTGNSPQEVGRAILKGVIMLISVFLYPLMGCKEIAISSTMSE